MERARAKKKGDVKGKEWTGDRDGSRLQKSNEYTAELESGNSTKRRKLKPNTSASKPYQRSSMLPAPVLSLENILL